MAERCAACGKAITTIPDPRPVVTLDRIWVHHAWWANKTHVAIPVSRVTDDV